MYVSTVGVPAAVAVPWKDPGLFRPRHPELSVAISYLSLGTGQLWGQTRLDVWVRVISNIRNTVFHCCVHRVDGSCFLRDAARRS